MFTNGYPYTDFHELNLSFLLESMEELKKAFASFTASNSLIFAEPMLHDLTSTYAKNTIVLDSDGNAYISLQNVPAGVQLSNADYWLMVFNFEEYTEKANKNFTVNYLRDTTRAPQAYAVGDWVVLDDVLYKVTVAIAADDLLEVGVNLVHFTVEQFLKDFITTVNNTLAAYSLTIQQYKNDIDASEVAYRNQLAQDIADTTASLQHQLDLAISGATVDSEVILARVGEDGITYTTLGDAIRSQVGWLAYGLDYYGKVANVTAQSVYSGSDEPITLASWDNVGWYDHTGTFRTTAGYTYTKNEIKPLTHYDIHYYSYYDVAMVVLDANDNVLYIGDSATAQGETAVWVDESIDTDINARYIVLSTGATAAEIANKATSYIKTWTVSQDNVAKNMSDIANLNGEVNNIVSALNKEFTDVQSLTMNDSTVLVYSSGQPSTAPGLDGYKVSDALPINPFDIMKIKCSTQYLGNCFYVIYDSNNDPIVKGPHGEASAKEIEVQIIAPDGAASIRVSQAPGMDDPSVTLIGDEPIPFNSLLERGYIRQDYEALPNKVIASNWTISPAGSFAFFVARVPCYGGEVLRITSTTNYNNPQYAWEDVNHQFVALVPAGGAGEYTVTDLEITAPSNAAYLIVNGYAEYPTYIERMQSVPKRPLLGKKWALIGDSLTDWNQRAYKHYFDYVNYDTGISYVNYGLSDIGYAKGIDQNKAFYQIIAGISNDFDVITIFGSFNDMASGLPLGTITDSTNATIAGCINLAIDTVLTVKPLANIGIVTPCPWEQFTPMGDSQAAVDYVDMLIDICKYRGIPYLDLFRCSQLRPWDSDYRTLVYTQDGGFGTHPDDTGHKILAPEFKQFIERLLI